MRGARERTRWFRHIGAFFCSCSGCLLVQDSIFGARTMDSVQISWPVRWGHGFPYRKFGVDPRSNIEHSLSWAFISSYHLPEFIHRVYDIPFTIPHKIPFLKDRKCIINRTQPSVVACLLPYSYHLSKSMLEGGRSWSLETHARHIERTILTNVGTKRKVRTRIPCPFLPFSDILFIHLYTPYSTLTHRVVGQISTRYHHPKETLNEKSSSFWDNVISNMGFSQLIMRTYCSKYHTKSSMNNLKGICSVAFVEEMKLGTVW